MNARTRSTVILVGTLILGMLLGALLTNLYFERRVGRMKALRTEEGFIRTYEDVIRPDEGPQKEKVREILRRSAPRFQRTFEEHRSEFRRMVDSLHAELNPLLTPDQRGRLEEWLRAPEKGRGAPR